MKWFYKLSLIQLLLSLFTCSCKNVNNKTDNSENTITVNFLSQNKSASDTLYLSSLIDSIYIIELDNTEGFMLGMIRDIKIFKNEIFISQFNQAPLLVFSKDGCCLRRIGNIGRGRGEYLEVSSFDINPITGEISICDNVNKRISKYSLYGDFNGSFTTNDFPQDIAITNAGNYLFYDPLYQFTGYNSGLWITNSMGENPINLLAFNKKEKWSCGVFPNYFIRLGEQIRLIAKDDNLYAIENGKITIIAKIDVDIQIPKSIKKQSYINVYEPYNAYAITNYFETDRFLLFTVIELSTGEQITVIIDKYKKETYYIDKYHPFIFDNIYGSIPFYICSNNKIIGVLDTSTIINNHEYQDLFKEYNYNSNAVLVIYNLKH